MDYESRDPFGLKPVWDAIISVYLEFAKICDRHSLRYFVVDGNALGAVRHGGFIPWDDDFDVAMPRADYEKFLLVAADELPPNLALVTWRNTPELNMISAKIQLADKKAVEQIERDNGRMLSNGIFVDVFPIDGAPTSDIEWAIGSVWYSLLECLLRFHNDKLGHQTRKGKVVWFVGMILSPFFLWLWTHDAICVQLEKLQRKYDFATSPLYDSSAFLSGLKRRKRHLASIWGVPQMAQFCGIQIPLPEKCGDYLTFWYGDYMKFPPEEARHPSHQYSWRCPWWIGPTKKKSEIES